MVVAAHWIRQAILAGAVVLASALAAGQALADPASSWTLAEQSGQVRLVKPGVSPIALTPGDVFSGGHWIETGSDGRAVLRRGAETIVVAPNSRIGLPQETTGPFATRILQTLGTILLKVEKQAKQHFEVQTPYLTAVVKGTTFTVGIQGERAVVHVVEGLVEVKNLETGRRGLVRPGQTGSVLRNGPADVQVEGARGTGAAPAKAAPAPARAQAKPAAPSSRAAAAPQAFSLSPAAAPQRASGTVTIKEALGPKTLDLSKTTKGLVRTAGRVAPRANPSQDTAAGAGPRQLSEVAEAKGLAAGAELSASALSTRTKALAAVQVVKTDLGRPRTDTRPLGQVATARPALAHRADLAAAGGVSANIGANIGANVAANPGLNNGIGLGIEVPPGLTDTPGNGNGNAFGHDKGKANGNANGHKK